MPAINASVVLNAVSQTGKEIRRAPCSFCIGTTSVLLVTIVAAVVQTLLARAPLIFLRLAETQTGQIDVVLMPSAYSDTLYLNYSRFSAALTAGPDAHASSFHAPRVSIPASRVFAGAVCAASPLAPVGWPDHRSDASWLYSSAAIASRVCSSGGRGGSSELTLVAIDSAREAAMGVGRAWDIPSIPPGECHDISCLVELAPVSDAQPGSFSDATCRLCCPRVGHCRGARGTLAPRPAPRCRGCTCPALGAEVRASCTQAAPHLDTLAHCSRQRPVRFIGLLRARSLLPHLHRHSKLVTTALSPVVLGAGLAPTQDAGGWADLAATYARDTAVLLRVRGRVMSCPSLGPWAALAWVHGRPWPGSMGGPGLGHGRPWPVC
jgi:hypothetical protein